MDFMILLMLIGCPALVRSHARLMSPPSRSSMWRLGFPTKKNFNDNALYCGGIGIQWQKNGGKCGICGDPYNMPHPRDNEAGGKYGRGIISKRYASGQIIQATVEVTTNHRGYFQFKLCPNNNPKIEATQGCLDKYTLTEARGTGNRYYVGDRGNGDITVELQLPKGLTCSHCVLQWTYVAGNNWGKCDDGESRLGCGPQETFRGCADIAIDKNADIYDIKPSVNDIEDKHHSVNPKKKKKYGHPKFPTSTKPLVYSYQVTRQSRQNRTKFNANHNTNHAHRKFYHRIGEVLTEFSGQRRRNSKVEKPASNERGLFSGRRLNRYDNRHFYIQNPNTPFRRNSPKKRISGINGDWPIRIGRSIKGESHVISKRSAQRTHYFQNPFPFMNVRSNNISLSQSFNLGGRRYKDFWLL